MKSEEPTPASFDYAQDRLRQAQDHSSGEGSKAPSPPLPSPLPWRERARVRGLSSLGQFMGKALGLVLLCLFSAPTALAQNDFQAGIHLFQTGQLVKAQQFFEAAHQRQPTHTSPVFYLGRIAFAEKNYEEAIPWFKKAANGAQCNADYHLWLGRAYGHRAQQVNLFRKPALAKQVHIHFEKAVGCDPDHVAARWDLMEYYMQAPRFLGGSRKKAEEQAAIITRLDPAEGRKARQFIAKMDE